MIKPFLTLVALITTLTTCGQKLAIESLANYDFERIVEGAPSGWGTFGAKNYTITSDSTVVKQGKYSVLIQLIEGKVGHKASFYEIPNNYTGKKITLSGFIRTEEVTEGFAGLWMRIDPSIAFNNMSDNGIKGTTDWTKYEITLEMNPEKTERIVVGGLLIGKGKMWIDDLKVTIDGKDLNELSPFERERLPAETDNEFDKGSTISLENLNQKQIEDIHVLGLVWGFLKYYHPNIAKGDYNWDYELFRILPEVLGSNDNDHRDQILRTWIGDLGPLSPGNGIKSKPPDIKIEPDLDWITQSQFSDELSSLLLEVKNAKRPKNHFYIGLQPNVGNPDFKNENAYATMKYPDYGYRILSLFRYWNIIQYYFPYKYLIEEDWKTVLLEFTPKVIVAKNETEYVLTMLELITRIHDTHANIIGGNQALRNYFGEKHSALDLTFIGDRAVVEGYYDQKLGLESGLVAGDIIISVNNRSVEDIIQDRLMQTPASNYPTKLRNISTHMLRTNDSVIHVEFLRDGIKSTKTLKAYSTSELNIYSNRVVTDTCFKRIDINIGYLNNGSLKRSYLPEIWEEIQQTKGLIIDCRNYPKDFVIYELSKYLLPDKTPFVKFSKGSLDHPGLFTVGSTLSVGKKNKNHYQGVVVILLNEVSQSSSEFHSMAYKVHPRATILGSTTAGADGNVSVFYLPGGIRTMITGIGVYYPDGGETQQIGIVPDMEIRPTIDGIKNGRDELLEKAIEIINGQ